VNADAASWLLVIAGVDSKSCRSSRPQKSWRLPLRRAPLIAAAPAERVDDFVERCAALEGYA